MHNAGSLTVCGLQLLYTTLQTRGGKAMLYKGWLHFGEGGTGRRVPAPRLYLHCSENTPLYGNPTPDAYVMRSGADRQQLKISAA